MRNLAVNDLLFYKDMKGNLILYKCLEVLNSNPVSYRIIQENTYNMEGKRKNPKSFETTTRNKNGQKRLFKFWLEFEKKYHVKVSDFTDEVMVLVGYYYNDDQIFFNFKSHTGTMRTFSVENLVKNVVKEFEPMPF